MTGRRALLTLSLLLLPGLAAAQSAGTSRRQRRRQRQAQRQPPSRRDQPLPLPPPPPPLAPVARGEPAPVPNSDIEDPRNRMVSTAPRVDPVLIDPNEPRYSATADPHSPQSREDRLLRQPAPGARLRVPFAY